MNKSAQRKTIILTAILLILAVILIAFDNELSVYNRVILYGIMIADLFVAMRIYRCPYCKKSVYNGRYKALPNQCPHCGGELHW